MNELIDRIRNRLNCFLEKQYQDSLRIRNHNHGFTLISNNCIGGVIYHNLGERFDSPTINLFITGKDYLNFVMHLQYYCTHCQMIEGNIPGAKYPIGVLVPDGSALPPITIHFQHYSCFEEALTKWNTRCTRIHWNNLHIIWEFYDNLYPIELIQEFDKLPFHKIVLTHRPISGIKYQFVLPCFKNEFKTGLTLEKSKIVGRRNLDDWDYVSFINEISFK